MSTMPSTILTDQFIEALAYANRLHCEQTRKGNDITYLSHLLGVSSLVLEAGGSEAEAIAGLLHDAVEDQGGMPTHAQIEAVFGSTVADIVLACSDSTDAATKEAEEAEDYWPRKQRYLDHLEDPATDPRAVMVSIADKVHNARAIVTDLQMHEQEVLGKFTGDPGEILTYYVECLRIGQEKGVPEALLWPLYNAVLVIDEYVMAPSLR